MTHSLAISEDFVLPEVSKMQIAGAPRYIFHFLADRVYFIKPKLGFYPTLSIFCNRRTGVETNL